MPKTQKPNRRPIRILWVGDDLNSHRALAHALGQELGFELSRPFETSTQALGSLVPDEEDVVPDIILFDPNVADSGGLKAIAQFNAAIPAARVIILTHSALEVDVLKAVKLGVAGYFLKSSALPQLIDGIRRVCEGGALLDPSLTKFTLDALQSRLPGPAIETSLTPREVEVLKLVAAGCSKKEIAMRLHLSASTIVSHVSHIYQKLKVPNAPAAIVKAYKLGIFVIRILLIMCSLHATANAANRLPSGRIFRLRSQPAALS